jgi:hypothetical protein
MQLPTIMQGRPFGPAQLAQIQALLNEHPTSSRYGLSRHLATLWNWRTSTGQLKDMAARTLLLKLHEQGWIQLPARRMSSPTRSGRAVSTAGTLVLDETPLEGTLPRVGPIVIEEVSQRRNRERRAQLEACLERYHYLGYRSRVGQNLQYWISSAAGRPLACVAFGAAAWQCAARDRWIGWSAAQRAQSLSGIVNNTRFLIFPWIRIPHLASHILGRISRRITVDWRSKYQQPLYLLETFVDRQRFVGTCYRAANWLVLGSTRGRGRQGPQAPSTSIKDVYVLPLHRRFRHHLKHPHPEAHDPFLHPHDIPSAQLPHDPQPSETLD